MRGIYFRRIYFPLSIFSFLPLVVFAQGFNICPSGATPGECVRNFYNFALLISGALAFGAIVYGGIKYTLAAGNPSGQSEGKEWVKSALLGLLLLAGAHLILRTINPKLVNLSLAELPGLPPAGGGQPPAPEGGQLPAPEGGLSDADARAQLAAAGIGVVAPTLQGIQQATVNELIRLKNECNCDVIVTSATSGIHAPGQCSHASGWKADLRATPSLSNFITSRYQPIGLRSDGAPQYRAPSGAIYADERNLPGVAPHWDMKVC